MVNLFWINKKVKGQTSIEFILLLVLTLAFISAVLNPILITGSQAIGDVQTVGQAKGAAEKLVAAADEVAVGAAGAVKTIFVFVPAKSRISCDNVGNRVRYAVALQRSAAACKADLDLPADDPNGFICLFEVASKVGADIECTPPTFDGGADGANFEVRISKDTTNIVRVA